MRSITDDVTDLLLEHHGAFSDEHGNGLARTEFNPKMYGEDLWAVFKELKTVFNPEWVMNPGNGVYRDSRDDIGPEMARGVGGDIRENLRCGSGISQLSHKRTSISTTEEDSRASLSSAMDVDLSTDEDKGDVSYQPGVEGKNPDNSWTGESSPGSDQRRSIFGGNSLRTVSRGSTGFMHRL